MPTLPLTPFDAAITYVINNEGATFTQAVNDKGECSRYGITRATLAAWRKSAVTCDDVSKLTMDEAKALYKARYWDALKLNNVGADKTATALLDMAVLTGTRTATRLMQVCVEVTPDYNMGPITLAAINSYPSNDLVVAYGQAAQRYFVSIVRIDATQAKWLYGWLCRASKLMMLAF